jgi:peptidoglycan-associated lipoprotein
MKRFAAIAIVTGACLLAAACKKTPVVASAPPDITPVKEAPPAPKQQAAPEVKQPAQQAKSEPAKPPAAEPKKLTPVQRAELNSLLAQLEDALFDYDKSTIRPDASAVLRENVNVIRNILADYPAEKLLIEGHADERGSTEYNLALGDRRAAEVQRFLTDMGIPASQLQIISYGEERPVCTETGETCWQRNRRAHITVAP